MSILAIETSTRHGSVALLADETQVAAARSWEGRDGHAAQLMTDIHELFQSVGCDPHTITAVAVAIGPGSFTGLRVGLATAKGLALGWQVPLIAVSTLAAMARRVTEMGPVPISGLVVPILDARQGEIYSAVFRPDGTVLVPEQVIAPVQWVDTLRTLEAPCRCFGDGYRRYGDLFATVPEADPAVHDEEIHHPHAGSVALCARDSLARGLCADLHTVVPNYLRRTYAEERRTPSTSFRVISKVRG